MIKTIRNAKKDNPKLLQVLMENLGLPDHVRQEDGTREVFERVFQVRGGSVWLAGRSSAVRTSLDNHHTPPRTTGHRL